MITSELLDYIRSALAVGQDPESIKNELRATGWIDDDINAAFDTVITVTHASAPSVRRWHMGKREILMGLVGVLLLGGVASGAYYFYPVSPEKILMQAGQNFENNVRSFDFAGKFEIEVTNSPELFSFVEKYGGRIAGANDFKFDLTFNGTADQQDANHPKSRVYMEVDVSPFEIGMELRTIDKDAYLKLSKLQDFGGLPLSQFSNQWVKFNYDDAKKLGLNQELPGYTAEQQRLLDELDFTKTISGFEKIEDDVIDGEKMHHFAYEVNSAALNEYLKEEAWITNQNYEDFTEVLEFRGGEIWVGKKDKLPRKINGSIVLKPKANQPSGSVNWELSIEHFNNTAPIIAPPKFKSIEEIVSQVMQMVDVPLPISTQ